MSVLILRYTNRHFQEQSYEYLSYLVQSHIDSLDQRFSQLQNYALFIANNKDVQDAVYYRNNTENIDYSIELFNQRNVDAKLFQLKTMPNIENAIIIGINNQALYSLRENTKVNYNFTNDEWFKEFKKKKKESGRISYFTGHHDVNYMAQNYEDQIISMLTPIPSRNPYTFTDLSYVMTDIKLSNTLFNSDHEHEVQMGIHDGKEWILLPELNDQNNLQKETLLTGLNTDKEYTLIKSKDFKTPDLLVVTKTSKITGWKIVGIKSLQGLQNLQWRILTFITILILIFGIIITLVSTTISKTILNPMNQLIRKFNQVAKGDYSVKFEESNSEEITKLSYTAEYMIDNIVKLSKEVLIEQEKFSNMQMKVLQNQINPHFLNNVLQTIKGFAITDDVENISKMTTLLGKILTYATYEPFKKVKLETELIYIENYITIQNIRYNNKIFYSIECEEGLKEVKIPKLIIQPIVENAIEHGFINKKSGLLTIRVEDDVSEISIIITDDGEGMPVYAVAELNENLQFKDPYDAPFSIGLLNVAQRIKKEYGEQYGLKVISRLNTGTNIIITLPKVDSK